MCGPEPTKDCCPKGECCDDCCTDRPVVVTDVTDDEDIDWMKVLGEHPF